MNSPHKVQWRGALMLSLICARINNWVNNREAGDLRRNRGHYDVIVMSFWRRQCRYQGHSDAQHLHFGGVRNLFGHSSTQQGTFASNCQVLLLFSGRSIFIATHVCQSVCLSVCESVCPNVSRSVLIVNYVNQKTWVNRWISHEKQVPTIGIFLEMDVL